MQLGGIPHEASSICDSTFAMLMVSRLRSKPCTCSHAYFRSRSTEAWAHLMR
jgi:hypothetical protein